MNSPIRTRYHTANISLHWITVLLLVFVYALIEFRGIYPKGSEAREAMKHWHFMLGMLVLLITVVRLSLRLWLKAPPITPTPAAWMNGLAHLMHVALYLFLLVMPVLGWLVLSAKGKPIPFFGLELPALIGSDRPLAERLEDWHVLLGTLGYWLIGLHAAAAIFHHHVLHDNTLRRMLPGRS